MTQSTGYFGGDYNNPAIRQFHELFEDMAGKCRLSDNDQAALIAVLNVHAWGVRTHLQEDFWMNVDSAIGDGVDTSLETEEDDTPLRLALEALSILVDAKQCYSLIAWLVQRGAS